MELSSVLKKVQNLINLAEHPNTGREEADSARSMADALMLKYAIDEALLDATRPASEQMKPAIITIQLTDSRDMLYEMLDLANNIARFCRCLIRYGSKYDHEAHAYVTKVYGYDSDLRYFEYLYTTLRLHMIDALRPKYDPSESLEKNAYRLHSAGFNWLEIAAMQGWKKMGKYDWEDVCTLEEYYDMKDPMVNRETGEWGPSMRIGSAIKRAFNRECAARGEDFRTFQITAGGSKTFRSDAISGYSTRIARRLREQDGKRTGIGTSLALRADAIEDAYREDNPLGYTRCPSCGKLSDNRYNCDICGGFIADPPPDVPVKECELCKKAKKGFCRTHMPRKYRERPYSKAGYEAGVRTANSADLSPRAGSSTKKEIS
jgi:hypothetical protein